MQTRSASRPDIRTGLGREALELYPELAETGTRAIAPVVTGKLASSLDLIMEALEEAGESPGPALVSREVY